MINLQLSNYIKQCFEQNFSKDQIKAELVKSGWPETDILEAFSSIPTTSLIIKSESLAQKPDDNKNNNPLKQADDTNKTSNKKLKNEGAQVVPIKKSWRLPLIKFNKTTVIITTTLAFLFLAAGALAYYYYFPSPERVISKMFDRLNNVNSLAYVSELKIEYQLDRSLLEGSFYKDFSGMMDSSILEWLAAPNVFDKPHQLILSLSGQSNFQSDLKNSVNFKIQTDELFNNTVLGAEVRSFDRLVYTNLDLPDLGFIDLSIFKNQWIKYDASSSINKLNNFKNLENASGTPGTSTEIVTSFSEKVAQIKNIIISSSVFQITNTLPEEKINETDARHYEFIINQENLVSFIREIDNKFTAEGKKLTEQEIIKIREFLTSLEPIKGEIWIGKKDFLPYKLLVNLIVKDQTVIVSDTEINPIKIKKIALTLSGQNFNQPINVQAPESTKSIEEMMMKVLSQIMVVSENQMTSGDDLSLVEPENGQSLLDGLSTSTDPVDFDGLPTEVKDEKIMDSDSDGLSDYEEKEIYKTNYLLPDTDGDGYLDGAEVNNGYNPNGEGLLSLNNQ